MGLAGAILSKPECHGSSRDVLNFSTVTKGGTALKCLMTIKIYHVFLSVATGINIFLDGFVPTENLRFRETSLVFKVAETADKV